MNAVKITVLVEDTAGRRGLLAEHGLALWIEHAGCRILFDTGQGLVLGHNAACLGVDLAGADAIALSHGHYDHSGGLPLALRPGLELYAHPAAFEPKFARNADGSARPVGMPEASLTAVAERARLHETPGPVEIAPGLWLTGPVPRLSVYENTGEDFFSDEACRVADELPDDQAAFFETGRGTVVILGCAHAGLINTLNYIRRLTNDRPIHAVLGGTHLLKAGPARLDATVAALRGLGVARLMPCHCTGPAATARLWHEFAGSCEACAVGRVFSFEV